mgnify:CR=1 FL=1
MNDIDPASQSFLPLNDIAPRIDKFLLGYYTPNGRMHIGNYRMDYKGLRYYQSHVYTEMLKYWNPLKPVKLMNADQDVVIYVPLYSLKYGI